MPAMGSHGGATAEGQRDVLAGYGMTRESLDMPVVSSMDVQQIGCVDDDMPVFMSTTALEADHVLLVNRVKPHTDFRGAYRERPGQDLRDRTGQAARRANDPQLRHARPGRADAARGALA